MTQRAAPAAPPPPGSPLADPVVDADAVLGAQRTTAWREGDARLLLLEGDARFSLGVYGFEARRAVVRIDTQRLPGRVVRHLSVYLDQAEGRGSGGAVSASGRSLLVTASTVGGVRLETDLLDQAESPVDDALVEAAAARIVRRWSARSQPLAGVPQGDLFAPGVMQRREAMRERVRRDRLVDAGLAPPRLAEGETPPGAEPTPAEPGLPRVTAGGQPLTPQNRILPVQGVVSFNADRIVYEQGEAEDAVLLIGDVRVFYEDRRSDRRMTLTAERVVIFLEASDAPAAGQASAGDVRGVYLEDNAIISDGRYTVRAPRVLYDATTNRAVLLEAVMYAYDIRTRLPLYARARVLRQTASDRFVAEDGLLTTSAFAQPHFAIGASRITIRQEQQPGGGATQRFVAETPSVQVGGVPVLVVPRLAGDASDSGPLRAIRVGSTGDNGPEVQTDWDLFALLGIEPPDGADAEASVDWLGDHGAGLGVESDYQLPGFFGNLDGYVLPNDSGEDDIGNRDEVEQDGEVRGFVRFQHRQILRDDWELSVEAAHVSGETFLEELFPDFANEEKPFENSLYLKKQQDDWAVSLLGSYRSTDFTPQLTTLQAPGYEVDKLPELSYFRRGTPLLGDRLTWHSDNSVSVMQIRPGDDRPRDRGFTASQAQRLFGQPETRTFDAQAALDGVPDDTRLRADTRQEIAAPMRMGPVDVTPYAVGRATVYDDDFQQFAGEDDQLRLWGALGTRVSTEFSRSYDGVESDTLELHRLRHIVAPSLDVFWAGSTLDSQDLPVFDADVESLSEGGAVRIGLTQTLQTQRGGPGRWRSVDWIVLRTDLVLRTDDAEVDQEIPRFFSYRPELSRGGDHFYTELLWMVSDTLGVTGELTQSLQDGRTVQWRLGATLEHSDRLTSFANYSEIDSLDSRLVSYGFAYRLTSKYTVEFAHVLDLAENDSRTLELTVERRLPQWRLRVVAALDEVEDDAAIGLVLIPEGLGAGRPGRGLLRGLR